VAENDSWRTGVLAISCVSNDAAHVNSMLDNVLHFLQNLRLDAELVDYNIEISYPF